jgi:membrane protein implicated in regulation of membrane protease activity
MSLPVRGVFATERTADRRTRRIARVPGRTSHAAANPYDNRGTFPPDPDMAPELVWLIAGIVLVIVELLTGTFYLLILGVAAMLAALAAWAGAPFIVEVLVAAVAAVAGTLLIRRRRGGATDDDGLASIDVGQPVIFETWTDAAARVARVRHRGASWDAEIAGDTAPAAGATLYIIAMHGSRLVVAAKGAP